MYLTPKSNQYYILDIESNGLDPDVVWCVCTKNLETQEEFLFLNQDDFNSWHKKDNVYVGHNAISFDIPILNKLWGCKIDINECVDTLILSYLYNPAMENGHSLEAWGERLKFSKGNFSDWSKLSDEMITYCKQDVNLNHKVYLALKKRMLALGYSEVSCKIEHQIRVVINEQQANGFWFDRDRAVEFLQQLRRKQSDLTDQIQRLFPRTSKLIKEGTFKYTSQGNLPAFLEKARLRYDKVVIDYEHLTYEYYQDQEFNIGSPKQRVERLLALGWKPDKFTEKGFPKVDEDALVAFSTSCGEPAVQAMAEWLVLQGRSSMVETWLNNLGQDSRIHGRVMTCGASTRRCTHSNPNSANIPSGAKAKYGHECRSLWSVESDKGLVLVGVDATGLETVGLLHYLPDKYRDKAAEIFNQKKPNDVHSMNARKLSELLGREIDREWGSKTSFYATLYGAYPAKLASIVKGSLKDGELVQEVLYNSVPGLKELIYEVQYEWKSNSGRIRCIDGGFVVCPSISAALNYRIQSLGAIVMKLACVILHEEARKQDLRFKLVGFIHDEFQMETKKADAEKLGKLAVWSIEEAARQLKFKVPLSGDYRIGLTWDATH